MDLQRTLIILVVAVLITACSDDRTAAGGEMPSQERLPYLVAENLSNTLVDFETSRRMIEAPDSIDAKIHRSFSNRLQLHLLRAVYLRNETKLSPEASSVLDSVILKARETLRQYPVVSIWKQSAEVNFKTVEPVLPRRFHAYEFLRKFVDENEIRPWKEP
jgi:hypothetical protein